eukprot:gene7104-1270_t
MTEAAGHAGPDVAGRVEGTKAAAAGCMMAEESLCSILHPQGQPKKTKGRKLDFTGVADEDATGVVNLKSKGMESLEAGDLDDAVTFFSQALSIAATAAHRQHAPPDAADVNVLSGRAVARALKQ